MSNYDANSLQNSFSVFKNTYQIDNSAFNASQFGSKAVGGKKRGSKNRKSRRQKRVGKTYKRGSVSKGRRTRRRI